MSELEKIFPKKSDKKNKKTENQCQNAASEQKTTSQILKSGANKRLVLE